MYSKQYGYFSCVE